VLIYYCNFEVTLKKVFHTYSFKSLCEKEFRHNKGTNVEGTDWLVYNNYSSPNPDTPASRINNKMVENLHNGSNKGAEVIKKINNSLI
jgi:hypothetical protein